MSLYSANQSQHVSIFCPGAAAVPQGNFTTGVLYRNLASNSAYIFVHYQPDNYGYVSMYVDGSVWMDYASFATNLDLTSPVWRWIILSKAAGNATPRVHWADYTSSGALTWNHLDMAGTKGNHNACNRISIGDEFSNGFRGELACMFSFTSLLSDGQIESLFVRDSASILTAAPQFFAHWPQASGVQFADIAGGGTEVSGSRVGTWSVSADPTNYDFSPPVTGRTGKPKVWDGSTWNAHQAKVWNGSAWVNHPVSGWDGSQWTKSK